MVRSAAVRQELDDPLTPVLALGAAASAVVGSSVDAALVAGVMTGNALIGAAQRTRAERALGELMLSQRIHARRVHAPPPPAGAADFARLRTAESDRVTADRLRTGDVVLLHSEDVVPADARLLWAESLEVDEATLTGESVPVDKSVEATPGADPADRHCMVYEGTTVVVQRGRRRGRHRGRHRDRTGRRARRSRRHLRQHADPAGGAHPPGPAG